jgi:hypothetical protein
MLVEDAPAFGQRQPSRRAVEQAHVQMRLELGDMARHGRDRHAEAPRCGDKAAGLDHLRECGQGLESIHSILLHN